jgi:hypothetical protein
MAYQPDWLIRLNKVHRQVHSLSQCPFDSFEKWHKQERVIFFKEFLEFIEDKDAELIKDILREIIETEEKRNKTFIYPQEDVEESIAKSIANDNIEV